MHASGARARPNLIARVQPSIIYCMNAIAKVTDGGGRSTTTRQTVGNDSATTSFAAYLRAFMRANGMTQNAELARYVGVEASAIGRWLSGQQQPSFDNLSRMAPRLGSLPDLLIVAGLATAEALGVSTEPREPLPPGVEWANALVRDKTISREHRRHLDQIVGYAITMWQEARNPPQEAQHRERT